LNPLDPGRGWPEAGITGLARPRDWDAVVLREQPELTGDELGFVALADGRTLPPEADGLARALDEVLERPYRAEAVRRSGTLWAAGAVRIQVLEGDAPGVATALELVVQPGEEPPFAIDRRPPYVLRARRLDGPLWEVETTPL
jgi:hypothetical protein